MKGRALLVLFLAGCSANPPPPIPVGLAPMSNPAEQEKNIQESLARLPDQDRAQAEAQKFCPWMERVRLGAKGPPIKLDVEGQTVFVCCKACEKMALKDPAKTLAKLQTLKEGGKDKPK